MRYYENYCPRCGKRSMKTPLTKNSLSRYIDIYICSECGTEEAIRDYLGMKPIDLEEWATYND